MSTYFAGCGSDTCRTGQYGECIWKTKTFGSSQGHGLNFHCTWLICSCGEGWRSWCVYAEGCKLALLQTTNCIGFWMNHELGKAWRTWISMQEEVTIRPIYIYSKSQFSFHLIMIPTSSLSFQIAIGLLCPYHYQPVMSTASLGLSLMLWT